MESNGCPKQSLTSTLVPSLAPAILAGVRKYTSTPPPRVAFLLMGVDGRSWPVPKRLVWNPKRALAEMMLVSGDPCP